MSMISNYANKMCTSKLYSTRLVFLAMGTNNHVIFYYDIRNCNDALQAHYDACTSLYLTLMRLHLMSLMVSTRLVYTEDGTCVSELDDNIII